MAALSGERTLDRRRRRDDCCGTPAGQARRRRDGARSGSRSCRKSDSGRGAVPEMTLAENALLTTSRQGLVRARLRPRGSRARVSPRRRSRRTASKPAGPTRSRAACPAATCRNSSSAARSSQRPKVMIAAQPTWGVDVGAAAQIRQALIDLRDSGVAVLVVSEELDELFEICDRLAVIAQGRLSPARPIARDERRGNRHADVAVHRAGDEPIGDREASARMSSFSKRARSRREPPRWFVAAASRRRPRSSSASCYSARWARIPSAAFDAFFIKPVDTLLRRRRAAAQGDAADADRDRASQIGYRANVWNIGAEGQLTHGRDRRRRRRARRSRTPNRRSVLPTMLVAAASLGGIAVGRDSAWLRTRFNANEILTSLMLVYVATLLLSLLVHDAWRDPEGFNFPQSKMFTDSALLPNLAAETRLNVGILHRARRRRARLGVHAQELSSATRCASRGSRRRPRTTRAFGAKRTVWLGMLDRRRVRGPRGRRRSRGTDRPAAADRCRPATASPRSSSRSSAGCIRSASCSRAC